VDCVWTAVCQKNRFLGDCQNDPLIAIERDCEDENKVTFCVGICVRDGLLALADTRIVKGDEHSVKSKLSVQHNGQDYWWVMTSGLRSIRDKAMTYFEQEQSEKTIASTNLFEIANDFGKQLRRVREEDGSALASGGFPFNSHAIIGGRLSNDSNLKMYYIYPEGNWIESNQDSPYFIIGRTPYAKPILDRLLRYDTPLRKVAALAFLAFDATRTCVTDVGFPIDITVLSNGSKDPLHQRFDAEKLTPISHWWNETLFEAIKKFPNEYFDSRFSPSVSAIQSPNRL